MSRWLTTDKRPYDPNRWAITFRCKNPRCQVKTQLTYSFIEAWHVCDVDCWNCGNVNTYNSAADLAVIRPFKQSAREEIDRQEAEQIAEEEEADYDWTSASWNAAPWRG